MGHSKLPFKSEQATIIDADGCAVAVICSRKETQDFIVTACNAHGTLRATADLFHEMAKEARANFSQGCSIVKLMTIIDEAKIKAQELTK